jgi:competence protein ComEC
MITEEKTDKTLFSPLVLAVLIIIICTLIYYITLPKPTGVKVSFFDVGQGDAALITTPEKQNILIDGGPDDQIIERLNQSMPFYHRTLDGVILSHPHADHLSGLLKVLDQYEVKRIYLTGVVHTTDEYLNFLEKIKGKGIETKAVKNGDELELGDGIKIEFLFPLTNLTGQTVDNLNNSSIVNRLVWGKSKVLFTGDLESEKQDEMVAKKIDLSAQVLKVPHHGSKDSGNENLIKSVSPKYAVISVGKENKFNHPSPSTLNLYRGIQVYRTDQDGTVTFQMSKENIVPEK